MFSLLSIAPCKNRGILCNSRARVRLFCNHSHRKSAQKRSPYQRDRQKGCRKVRRKLSLVRLQKTRRVSQVNPTLQAMGDISSDLLRVQTPRFRAYGNARLIARIAKPHSFKRTSPIDANERRKSTLSKKTARTIFSFGISYAFSLFKHAFRRAISHLASRA